MTRSCLELISFLAFALAVEPAAWAKKRQPIVQRGVAEEQPVYQPGPPPPLDQGDFDDPGDDDFDAGDQPARFQAPPPPPSATNGNEPPAPVPFDFRSGGGPGGGGNFGAPKEDKLHFRVVDGVFWQKGKRRGRASDDKKSSSSDTNSNSHSY